LRGPAAPASRDPAEGCKALLACRVVKLREISTNQRAVMPLVHLPHRTETLNSKM